MMLTVRFLLLDLLAVAPRVAFFTFLDLFLLQLLSMTTVFLRVLLLEGAFSFSHETEVPEEAASADSFDGSIHDENSLM